MIYEPTQADSALLQDDLLTRGVMFRRIIAWVLDAVLIALLCAGAWTFLVFFGVLTLGLGFPLLGLLPVIPVLYHWLTIASAMSATPGQAMMGLVVRRNDDLGSPTPLQALVFTVLFYVTVALGVIWMGVALLTVRHRTFHDMLSGLVVVRARALTPPTVFWNMPPGGASPV
ncbi:RDD family protein [Limobrevibacterium gyesilva]|uniref:RDD family protein n=1 Tax=Limobrevibacterium gyesilva TaxID=2991712 RepID=A0AA41YTG5_9PROT|nr:RDD family protein [Limobrevibacterium gyesilva]MCW3476170.1 RDD family protein [Limobrevibacterium gyesilva]